VILIVDAIFFIENKEEYLIFCKAEINCGWRQMFRT